jgi:pilus assembly protein CpaC
MITAKKRSLLAALAIGLAIPVATEAPAFAQKKDKGGTVPKDDKALQQETGLAVGETRTIPAGDVKQYSEGTPGIVDVRLTPDGSKFVLVGQRAGSTSLLLIKNDGAQVNWVINVFSRSPELVERELGQLMEGYPGLRIRRVGSRLFIEGGVSNEMEQKRTVQLAALYPGQVESLVTVGTGAIDRRLNIRVDFFFVQYEKTSNWQIGIQWPGQYGGSFLQSEVDYSFLKTTNAAGQTVGPGLTGATVSLVNQALPGLDLASTRGWVKVLKQATVITTNGNEAHFANGGEQNFQVTSGFAASIQKIEFGTTLSVLPRYDPATHNIEVRVQADTADLTPPQSTATILPGRNTSKLSTLVYLKLGQSLVLSGIRSHSDQRSTNGIPGLSWIPVLGVLFGALSSSSDDIEGAVFIIPSVVESVPKAQYDVVKEALDQYDDYSGDIRGVKTFQKTPPDDGAGPPPAAPPPQK